MKIIHKKHHFKDESSAAHDFSERLGGLAFATDVVAKQIKTRKRFKTTRLLAVLRPALSYIAQATKDWYIRLLLFQRHRHSLVDCIRAPSARRGTSSISVLFRDTKECPALDSGTEERDATGLGIPVRHGRLCQDKSLKAAYGIHSFENAKVELLDLSLIRSN